MSSVRSAGVSEAAIPELSRAIEQIPMKIAAVAAEVLSALGFAVVEVAYSFPWAAADFRRAAEAFAPEALAFAAENRLGNGCARMVELTDLPRLARAAELIARATEKARSLGSSGTAFGFEWLSPLGRIVIAEGGGHRHDLQDALFVLDLGKRNQYAGGRPGSQPVTVVIDGGGSQFEDVGPAVCGITEIFVLSGKNLFTEPLKRKGGVGGAAFGVSLVHCRGGGNYFDAQLLSQGAAVCGIGVVVTDGGNNRYRCYSRSQGFGGVRGFGCLVDSEGGSEYIAEDGFLHNAAPQTPGKHNASLSQGVGQGFRGGRGFDMAGGVGLLVNGGGGNRFRCGVFGQGAGYLLGIGGLVVRGPGNDFEGVWYVQGAAAHYSFGCLIAKGGKDRFHALEDQAEGVGVDFAIGLFHSVGGNSSFTGGSGRLGMGIDNGIGICVAEGAGNAYEPPAKGRGFAQLKPERPNVPCFGIFVDGDLSSGARVVWQPRPTADQPLFGVSRGHMEEARRSL